MSLHGIKQLLPGRLLYNRIINVNKPPLKILYVVFAFSLLFQVHSVNSQDTINFRLFDSLKTSAEDNHKSSNKDSLIVSAILRNNIYKNDPDCIDVSLFREINNSRSGFKDDVFGSISRSVLPVTLLMPSSMFIYSRATGKTYDENSAYLTGGSLIINTVLTMGTKFIIKRDRPRDRLMNVYSGEEKPDKYSFPSAHSSYSFTTAGMLVLRYTKYPQVYVPVYIWAIMAGYSRPYLGMHYPADVIAGAVIGTGSSVIIYSLRKELFKLKNNLFNEENNDDGSVKGGTAVFFAGSFAVSEVINELFLKKHDKVKLNTVPGSSGFLINVNISF